MLIAMSNKRFGHGLLKTYTKIASQAMALPPQRDEPIQFIAKVIRIEDVTPSFRRVTFFSADFKEFELMGPDEYFGLLMPPPGRDVVLPELALDPRSKLRAIPESDRPELRWYTIRQARPGQGEFVVDIVNTGHGGPGSSWVKRVALGDMVGFTSGSALYGAAPDSGHHLLLADETGLPGAIAIAESARANQLARVKLTVMVEVPSEEYILPDTPKDFSVVYRGDADPGSAMIPALATSAHDNINFAWICAEGGTVGQAKKIVTREWGLPRTSIVSSGFWRKGRPRP